jgi:GMP synthase (glutamine-hydrolysing)
MKIHYLQNVPFEGLGSIADWAQKRGHQLSSTQMYNNTALPSIGDFDMLIVMGGSMGACDEKDYPWLKNEKELILSAIKADKFVLGICLGAQLIANVLGARVYRNPEKEIGWWEVHLNDKAQKNTIFEGFPPSFTPFQWHGDTFDMPMEAEHLIGSQACVNQAFIYNKKTLALQFHFETTPQSLQEIMANCGNEIQPANFIQSREDILANQHHMAINHQLLEKLLDQLTAQ